MIKKIKNVIYFLALVLLIANSISILSLCLISESFLIITSFFLITAKPSSMFVYRIKIMKVL